MAVSALLFANGKSEKSGSKEVTFWYGYKGSEAAAFENAIAKYNQSQSKYVVTGLNVTDQQKLIVALASNEAPDCFQLSNQDVINFQSNGLLQSLQPLVNADKYDLSVYSQKSLEANTVKGEVYALPLSGIDRNCHFGYFAIFCRNSGFAPNYSCFCRPNDCSYPIFRQRRRRKC